MINDLSGYLSVLIGETFRIARPTYGDELTLHFGDLHEPKSQVLGCLHYLYGEFILSTRGSYWVSKDELKADTVVLTIYAFTIDIGYGLYLELSDKNVFLILPSSSEPEVELADWNFLTPNKELLSVGPGSSYNIEYLQN